YYAAGRNEMYAKQGRAATNDMAEETRSLFKEDTTMMGYFNRSFLNGKWNHFMDQAHLGYTSWNDPPENSLRAIALKEITIPDSAIMGVAIEGSESVWPGEKDDAVLPSFDELNQQSHYIDIFNKGKIPFKFTAAAGNPWIKLSETSGTIEKGRRIRISIDWDKAPKDESDGTVQIKGTGKEVLIKVHTFNPAEVNRKNLKGFAEGNGYVSIEAEHYTKQTDTGTRHWIKIEDYGRTLSGMRTAAPPDASPAVPGKDSPCLEYNMYLFGRDSVEVKGIFSATLNFIAGRPLQYAVSFDDESPKVITLVPADYNAQNGNRDWEKTVMDNARYSISRHFISEPGYHTLKIWMVDPGVVLEKIVVDAGGVKSSYLGPPESFHNIK
ncbi:MAG: hypothetical protein WCE54_12745, partial [Ignavibacteriaceae bacterium]